MGENFKRFEDVCQKKFDNGSFGILTPIFDPAYPSLKYVFFIFLLIRTVFYICTFSIHDTFLVHAEFIIGIFVIVMSFLANESIEYRHTVLEEPMYFLMPSFGFLILFSLLFACIRGDVSSSYYILIEIDSIFFFYTLYIRVKEIYYKLNRRKYSLKHDFKKREENALVYTTSEIRFICDHIFKGLNGGEIAILRGSFKYIENLFFNSYSPASRNIYDKFVFFETAEFIKDLYKTIETYKTTKIFKNIEYLEKIRDSVDKFCETMKSHNMDKSKEKFNGAVEALKIKVGLLD